MVMAEKGVTFLENTTFSFPLRVQKVIRDHHIHIG